MPVKLPTNCIQESPFFGAYLKKYQHPAKKNIIYPIPVKAYGRPPTQRSQNAFYHDEDYNYITRASTNGLNRCRREVKPWYHPTDFASPVLNNFLMDIRTTLSARHAIDDFGGFDNYLTRCPPEEMRTYLGEQYRKVACMYQQNPQFRNWGLPVDAIAETVHTCYDPAPSKGDRALADPMFARHKYWKREKIVQGARAKLIKDYSPYFLPEGGEMYPVCDETAADAPDAAPLTLWWKQSKSLEEAFRDRLGKAVQRFHRYRATFRLKEGHSSGQGMGGGGRGVSYHYDHKKHQK